MYNVYIYVFIYMSKHCIAATTLKIARHALRASTIVKISKHSDVEEEEAEEQNTNECTRRSVDKQYLAHALVRRSGEQRI